MPTPLIRRDSSGPVHLYDDLVPLIVAYIGSFETLSIAAKLNSCFLLHCRVQYSYLADDINLWQASETRHFASHEWDFRTPSTSSPSPSPSPITVKDSRSPLLATLHDAAYLSPSGLVFPPPSPSSNRGHASINPFSWGGPTSIEVSVQFSSFSNASHVFDFGDFSYLSRIFLCNFRTTNGITLCVRENHEAKYVDSATYDGFEEVGRWTHLVITMEGPCTKLYKNGQLIKMSVTSQEPEECLRDAQVLGAYLKGDGFHMEGVIGFLRFWNGKILSHEQVGELYEHAEYKRKPAKVKVTKRVFLTFSGEQYM
ncbi:hypothetical protein TrST_g7437 [Triparma strigata]|uniref:Uncharacterized protein n=1 Tax=Triparma strigata TaxID=1606541 RepID=A0A9W6ZHN0_9STRA|nr:hypothetical protein TrST_g7437 [Triparma strigata]